MAGWDDSVRRRVSRGLFAGCIFASAFGPLACGGEDERPGGSAVAAPPHVVSHIPYFGGVASGRVTAEGVVLEWYPAADDETATDDLVYSAYAGVGQLPVDLSAPVAVSLPGAESLLVVGLEPADYRFVVRVTDADGNEDDNRAAVRVSTLDELAPEFGGVVGASAMGSTELVVQWEPGRDDTTPSHELVYRVYVGEEHDTVFDSDPVAQSEPGAVSKVIELNDGWAAHWVGVRAVDASGNEDQNLRATSIDTPEGEPPRFGGLISAEATRNGIVLKWSPAVDNMTSSSGMKYQVFFSESSGGQDFSRPNLVTDAGVTQVTVTGLEPGTEFFFIVRAVDAVGNTDKNTVQLSAETLPPDVVPPTFFGATGLESFSPTSLRVSWSAANDVGTPSARMRYQIFLSETSDDFDFDDPTLVTPPGRLQAELLRLDPGTTYFVVVRAVDLAGNVSNTETEIFAETLPAVPGDIVPPTLTGLAKAQLVPSDAGLLLVTWGGMEDDTSSEQQIRGHVCVGASADDCQGSNFYKNYNVTGAFGARSVFVSGLSARTTYQVAIRLEDSAGNYATTVSAASGFTATSYEQNVEPILAVRCNQCHGYSYGTLVNIFEDEYQDPVFGDLYLVDTTSATQSYLIRKLRGVDDEESPFSPEAPAGYLGDRMPSDGSEYLSPEVEQVFIDWIDQGAFFN